MTTNIQGRLCICHKNTENWHFARHITTNLEDTMLRLKHISEFHHHIFGRKFIQTSSITQKRASAANRENLQQTNHLCSNHFQFRTGQTSGYTLTFSVRCLLLDGSTNTSSASQTHSQNTPWSRLWRTNKLKLWLKPFFQNGFVNSASQRRFTLTAGRSLSTSSLTSYLRF